MRYEIIYFDIANTLLYKDKLYQTIKKVLKNHNYEFPESIISEKHWFLSEILLPDSKTTRYFYKKFNKELLYSLGVTPTDELTEVIYSECKKLRWKKYDDVSILKSLPVQKAVISNWDKTLQSTLNTHFNKQFKTIACSYDIGIQKPHEGIYKKAIEMTNIDPGKALYVGNSLKLDIAPAKKIGINTVLIDRENRYPYTQERKINSLNELRRYI